MSDPLRDALGSVAGTAARAGADALGAPPLIGDLAEQAVKLAIAVVGPDRVQAILDAEYALAERAADATADALEHEKFVEPTTAKATPEAKKAR